jgi:saccharopepsin
MNLYLNPFLIISFRVIPPGGIGKFNDTGIALELLYGDGSYGTKGTIGVAPFQFGSYHIDKQAFMNVQSSTITGLQELGIYGLMGLSFDFSTASPINGKIKSLYGAGATWGRSVLQNIFAQNASEPNFIAIHLARTGDLEDTDGGSLLIGEYDNKYAGVAKKPKLPQYPKGGDRWTTLLEGISVDGKAVAVSSTIAGVPAGSAQALLDTGDPTSIFPVAIHDAIYSSVPGSAKYSDDTGQVWFIPCNTTTHVELQFG